MKTTFDQKIKAIVKYKQNVKFHCNFSEKRTFQIQISLFYKFIQEYGIPPQYQLLFDK